MTRDEMERAYGEILKRAFSHVEATGSRLTVLSVFVDKVMAWEVEQAKRAACASKT
jgi:hypothetical protein